MFRHMKVRKAVIPVAGLGTRFLPATKSIPKEMIPIVDVPMIQFIVEEAVKSGIEDVILVTARHKDAIENHFDYAYELEDTLQKRSKTDLVKTSKSVAEMCNIISVRQKNPMGLGHAVLMAEPIVGNEPFAVILGDDLIFSDKPCTKQLIEIFEQKNKSVVGVMEVPKSEVSKYGIVGGTKLSDLLTEVLEVIEKPNPEKAPSPLAIPGRYILHPEIFAHLKKVKPGSGGEIQLTDGLLALAQSKSNKGGLLAYQFEGIRHDGGDRLGYIEATIAYALSRPDLKEGVRKILKKYG
jgi:UTP--glucose-1-phosphate uridylyltransferase